MPSIRNKQTMAVAMLSGTVALLACTVGGCNKSQSAQTLVSEAKQYQQKGDNKAAVIQLKNALQKNPDDAEARYLLGTLYNEGGDALSAEKEIRKAISLGMSKATAMPGLAKSLFLQGQMQKVLDETKDDPKAKTDAEMATLRGNANLALGHAPEAKESFELALKAKPDFPDALIGLAKYALMQKDVDEANRLTEQAVTKNPKNIDAWFFKGDLLRNQAKTNEALAAYDEALKIKPDSPVGHIMKADLEINTEKYAEAKIDLDAAKKVAPRAINVLYTQALFDFKQKQYPAALESLQQILSGAPEHMPSLLLAGIVQFALGSTQQAEQNLKKYVEKNPQNLFARKMLASVLLKNKQADRALDVLAPALKEDVQDAQLFGMAGEAYMQTKNFSKATEYFEKSSTLSPKTANAHTALGLSKLEQGDSASGIAELEKAASLDPKSQQAGVVLVMTHLRMKEYDKALAAVKAIEKEQPDNPLVQNLKAGVYLGKGDTANARASLQKAVSLQPTYFPAIANLAQLDLQEKKPDAAKKRFETLLELDKKSADAMTALGNIAAQQGQNAEAKTWLERANKEAPNALPPARALIMHYLRTGEKQPALALATKLYNANTTNPLFIELLAQTQTSLGDKAAALDSYNKLAVVMPDSAAVQFRIASLSMALKDEAGASSAIKKALRLDPNFIDAQLAAAELDMRKGNYSEALSVAKQIQKAQDKSPAGYVLEGDVLLMQKKPALALKPYEQAWAINKSGPQMEKLHAAMTQAGKSKEADARIMQWLKEHPADLPTQLYFSHASLESGHTKVAIEHYEAYLKEDPKNANVLNNLAWLYSQEKDPRALEYAEKANQIKGDNPAILDTLGWLLVGQGNVARGLPMLQKAGSLAPEAYEIRYHYAQALAKSGDKVKARKELEQILASGKTFPNSDEAKALLKTL